MIRFDDVTKIYRTHKREKRVLDRISFVLERGQSLGIIGRNGAGKSTLTRLIAGGEYPTTGAIRREMSISFPIGFTSGFQGSLTGADNARFIARIYGVPWKPLISFVEDFAELGDYLHMPVKTYSTGMQARLAFGISLAIQFDCYLVDEVTAAGDASFVERCERMLAERRKHGSLVMISHDMATIRQYCDRAAVLERGRLTLYDNVEVAIAAYLEMMQVNETLHADHIAQG